MNQTEQKTGKKFNLKLILFVLVLLLNGPACNAGLNLTPVTPAAETEPTATGPAEVEAEGQDETKAEVEQGAPQARAGSLPGNQPGRLSFTGTWHSANYGPIILKQEDTLVIGAYILRDQYGYIAGEVTGNRLEHIWWQGPTLEVTFEEAESRGDAYFSLSADGQQIEGKWRSEGEAEWAGDWNLTRLSDQVDPAKLAPIVKATGTPAGTDSGSILLQGTTHLALGGSVDLDGSGVDFWSDQGGVAARSPEYDPNLGDYETITFSYCRNAVYFPDIPWGPFPGDAYCFMTDQGHIGKFVILAVDENGGLNLGYTVWNYTSPTVPHPAR